MTVNLVRREYKLVKRLVVSQLLGFFWLSGLGAAFVGLAVVEKIGVRLSLRLHPLFLWFIRQSSDCSALTEQFAAEAGR